MPSAPRTITVVIPVKDDARHLEVCLAALARQTREPLEIVVVDNGSTDDSAEVARAAGARVVDEREPGIPAAASAGYDAARGEIIARLDADSEPHDDWLQRLGDALDADADLSAVTGPGDFTSLPSSAARLAEALYMRPYFRVFTKRLGHPPLFGSNFAMTRETWLAARDAVHRHDPEVHDDLDLSYALAPGSRVLLLPEATMPISARPFTNPLAFVKRVRRGRRTMRVNREPKPVVHRRGGLRG